MRSLALIIALAAGPASAHEFWLEAEDYTLATGDAMTVSIVNGDEFKGQKIPYLPQKFITFLNISGAGSQPVPGRVGDRPAVQIDAPPEGLNVLAYESTDSLVEYDGWDVVTRFVAHKGLDDFYADHAARGLPEEPFREVYSRYSKALIAVGNGVGADRRTGLETEIVALTNPYTDDLSDGMAFQLWYGDAPRADARFEVWDRSPAGEVRQTFYRTDAEGRVTVPVEAGHAYMADAVLYREPSAATVEASGGAVWETLWANMTWAVPE
ncbi:DUF4198 domain-containing protein [Salipiger sp. IMCC34102]|uniref:DUF4198 domain-containing protein n=1 Tax=Salipiger sp. IMCC34102 TaxID=2510647 RepID=UPI00101E0494|nr:DUF4198 domain-containing protein [Salipiger sp. IMCC34102]RYH03130.1 DUF4198 domain-containing protein [Salipiger sp. IMCC34102]